MKVNQYTELLDSKRARKLYKAAKDFVKDSLENEFVEGFKQYATKTLDKYLMDGIKGFLKKWKDYLVPKAQAAL